MSKFYLVILDGNEVDDIIYSPLKIKEYLDKYFNEGETETDKKSDKKNSKGKKSNRGTNS